MQKSEPVTSFYRCSSCGHLSKMLFTLCPRCKVGTLSRSVDPGDMMRMHALDEQGERELRQWVLFGILVLSLLALLTFLWLFFAS